MLVFLSTERKDTSGNIFYVTCLSLVIYKQNRAERQPGEEQEDALDTCLSLHGLSRHLEVTVTQVVGKRKHPAGTTQQP